MSVEIEDLRAIIADDKLPVAERKIAAEHAVQLTAAAIDAAGIKDDDPEVLERRKPWTDRAMADLVIKATGSSMGVNGESLADATKTVLRRRKLRALLNVIVDETRHRLERLAACRLVLDEHLHPRGRFRMNGYSEQQLLDAALPATATKWTRSGNVPVERPPVSLADVW